MAVALVVAEAAPIQAAPLMSVRAALFTGTSFDPIQLDPSLGPGSTGTDNNASFLVDTDPAQGRLAVPVPDDVGFSFSGLTLSANGAPFLTAPTFEIGTSTFSGAPGTRLLLEFTQTSVTLGGVKGGIEFVVTPGPGSVSATISSYVSSSGLGFALDTLLSSATFSGTGDAIFDVPLGAPATYSMTTVMEITFAGPVGTRSTVAATARLEASDTPRAVPEPTSLALVGAGLLGLGFARRRRR